MSDKPKWYVKKTDKEGNDGGTFKSSELFGLKEEEADEMIRFLRHARIDAATMEDLAAALDLQNAGQLAFKAFCFGKLCAENETGEMMSEMLGKLKGFRRGD